MNRATRTNVAVLSAIFGLSGMSHGFFEILQGNVSTNGLFISAVGEAQKMWPHGDEPALTLMPNFLVTGIVAVLVGLALVVWSVGFVQRKNGPTILLFLYLLLLLFGGGVAQALFFPWIWLVSTRIHKPLTWWRRVLSDRAQRLLGRLWPGCLIVTAVAWVFALWVAFTGIVPGLNDPEVVVSVMLVFLVAASAFLPLAFVTGFARDVATGSDHLQ